MDGLLVIDKEAGRSSAWVVGRVKYLLREKKAGHAGTLDPQATGVLVLGLGRATRVLRYAEAAIKEYEGVMRLGQTTDTDDADGAWLTEAPVPRLTVEDLQIVIKSFTGIQKQTPPPYSALKVNGQRAYARARRGETVVLEPREVRIDALEIMDWNPAESMLRMRVVCSKGTYIRALARDIGAALGCGGHLTALRRIRVGLFGLEKAVTLTDSIDPAVLTRALLPMETALSGLRSSQVSTSDIENLHAGRAVETDVPESEEPVYVKSMEGLPVCLAKTIRRDGRLLLQPERSLS